MTLAVNIAQSGSNNQTFRNRIINGAMTIAQRGTGVFTNNVSSGDLFPVDRFNSFVSGSSGVFTTQQSSDVPTGSGFKNSIICTVTTADSSLVTGDLCAVRQIIEGLNSFDLAWGTANAQPVTLSFWAKSSIAGIHSGTLTNGDWTRAYAFSYTLAASNTWQYITVTIPGAPSGSWGNGNDRGIQVVFNMGAASANLSTANTWSTTSAVTVGATGSVQLISTNGATWYVTGVQLEEGTAASPFEFRQYGTELQLCQRYFQQVTGGLCGVAFSSGGISFGQAFPVPMRAAPSSSLTAAATVDQLGVAIRTQSSTSVVGTSSGVTPEAFNVFMNNFSSLTFGNPCSLLTIGGRLQFSAEL